VKGGGRGEVGDEEGNKRRKELTVNEQGELVEWKK
jgi:hypothetical protein